MPEKSRKCPRCENDQWIKLDPSESTLQYEQLPAGVEPAPIMLCADRTVGGKLHKGCALELRQRHFVFETETWHECQFTIMELTKASYYWLLGHAGGADERVADYYLQVFRQSDTEFIGILNQFRRGICDEGAVQFLRGCGTALDALVNKVKVRTMTANDH